MKFIKSNLYDIVFIYFAIFSCLYCFGEVFTLFGLENHFIFLIVFPLIVIKIIESDNQKLFYALLLAIIVIMLLNFNNLVIGYQSIFRIITKQSTLTPINANTNGFMAFFQEPKFISLLFTYLLLTIANVFCILRKKGMLLAFLISALLFIPTTYQSVQNWTAFILVFIYWILLFFTTNQRSRLYAHKKSYKFILIVAVAAITLESSIPMNIEGNMPSLMEIVNKIKNIFTSSSSEMIDLEQQGNRYYQNIITINIEASEPQDTYLKYYSAGVYEDNRWKNVSDETYDEKSIQWEDIVSLPYNSSRNIIDYTIEDKTHSKYKLTPYGYIKYDENNFVYDNYITTDKSTYNADFTLEFNEAFSYHPPYDQFVREHYLSVDADIYKLFNDLSLEKILIGDTQEQIMENIKNYLADTCTYTLEPGLLPSGKEFIHYFLQENKEGYCVHFATTAVLMARYMGIPARYVEGYHVRESDYNEENHASLRDNRQHAWVETFNDSTTWMPYDVTPAAEQTQTNNNQNTNIEDVPDNNETEINTNNNQQNQQQNTPTNTGKSEDNELNIEPSIIIGCLLAILALIILVFFPKYIWQRINNKVHDENRKIAIVNCHKYLSICQLKQLEYKDIFDKALYSQHDMEEKEYQLIITYFQSTMKQYYHTLKVIDKLRFQLKLIITELKKVKK